VKVLLTGGTGFLGRNVARSLAARGHELRVLAREASNLEGLPPGAAVVGGDVTDLDSLQRAAEGCAAVVHLAALVKVWVPDPERFRAVNVGGLRNALEAAASAGARLVYTSSFMAVGPSGPVPADESRFHSMMGIRNPYERTKAEADVIAREAAARGQDVVMLYPGVVYGPGDMTEGNLVARLVSDHLRGKLPALVGPGNRLWSYSYVTDVADGHALALEKAKRGERYFLCGENATLTDLFALVHEMTGVAPPRWHLPFPVAAALGRGMWIWAELTGLSPQMTQGEVGVFREHWAYSSAKAERDLGYRSRPLRDGLRETIDWLRSKGAA
jgi:NAD+-dependent farnesol dehydrogenase